MCSSNFNPVYTFPYAIHGAPCNMVFTSVAGHLMELEFGEAHRKWHACNPVELYSAPVYKRVPQVCHCRACSQSACSVALCSTFPATSIATVVKPCMHACMFAWVVVTLLLNFLVPGPAVCMQLSSGDLQPAMHARQAHARTSGCAEGAGLWVRRIRSP